MKQIFVAIATIFLFIGCENGGGEKTTVNKDSLDKIAAEEEKVKKAEEGMEKAKADLDKLTPLGEDDLKKLLPQTLGGGPIENASVENNSGVNIATADYKVSDSNSVTLSIIDCAGSAGVGIYTRQFLGMATALSETDEEYTKEITIAGNKGYEHCTKEDNDCVMNWFAAGRYLVSLEGYDAAVLKKLAGELKLK
jgi:hypothetical protein